MFSENPEEKKIISDDASAKQSEIAGLDIPLRKAIQILESHVVELGNLLRSPNNPESANVRISELEELICIQSRSALVSFMDAAGWDNEGNTGSGHQSLETAFVSAQQLLKGRRFEDRIGERLSELDEWAKPSQP